MLNGVWDGFGVELGGRRLLQVRVGALVKVRTRVFWVDRDNCVGDNDLDWWWRAWRVRHLPRPPLILGRNKGMDLNKGSAKHVYSFVLVP